jgi:rubrerythrin
MVLHNTIDPHGTDFESAVYECAVCGVRSEAPGACPDCGVDLRNTAVPRE